MKLAKVSMISVSPYSQSKHYTKDDVPKISKGQETHDDYEKRTWRHRCHVTKDGSIEIPGLCFSNGIKEAAKSMGKKIPGRASKTYKEAFATGIMCPGSITLPVKVEDVPCEKLFVPADGIPGSGKRVMKYFPRIDEWRGDLDFYIFNDAVTQEVFEETLTYFGQIIGIGRFRPANRGFYGRFIGEVVEWDDDADVAAMAAGF